MELRDIKPDSIYTTNEARHYLKISNSTMKRWLKKGLIKANKIGGRYRIWGKEILQLISPSVEQKAVNIYQKIKKTVVDRINKW